MSKLLRLLLLLLIPALSWGQSVDQRRVGLYMATQAGTDCSQATLELADDQALAAGQLLVIPPNDRFRASCQWAISSNLTIESPVFFPYNSTPVLKVDAGIVLTLDVCPVVWSDYSIIDADGITTGDVNYTATCGQCTITGPNDWISCATSFTGISSESQLEALLGDIDIFTDSDGALADDDLTDDTISALSNVNADANAADDEIMIGDGTTYRGVAWPACNITTQKVHFDGSGLVCESDASGPGAAGDITDVFNCATGDCSSIALADGDFLDMSSVVPNTTTEGLRLPQTTDCSSAIAMGQVCVDSDNGSLWIGNDSESVQVSTAQTLQDIFTNGKVITGANSAANALQVGNGTAAWRLYCDGTNECFMDTDSPSDSRTIIPTDKNYELYDEEGGAAILTVDPDAADVNAMWQFAPAYRWVVSSEVLLRPLGDCAVAEEAIVTNDPLDEWVTCADTTGDAVTFNYKVTKKLSSDTTIDLTLYAVNKNAAPTGTYELQCAAQSIRPGLDAYAAHSTTGQQAVSFSTFDTQNRLEVATATFTLNGTLAAGAHIKGQCNVSTVPAQIADIRLSGTGLIQLSANSPSD